MSKSTSITVKLEYPIEWATAEGKAMVEEVVLRRPRGKDIKNIGSDVSVDDMLKIAAKISPYTPRFFEELDAVDCLAVTEVIGDFLSPGRETGKTN